MNEKFKIGYIEETVGKSVFTWSPAPALFKGVIYINTNPTYRKNVRNRNKPTLVEVEGGLDQQPEKIYLDEITIF